MGEAQAAQHPPVGARRGAMVTKGSYQKWDIETRHPDLVGGMVQHPAALFFPAVVQLPGLALRGQERSFGPCTLRA